RTSPGLFPRGSNWPAASSISQRRGSIKLSFHRLLTKGRSLQNHEAVLRKVWVRSRGRCECTSCCGHHKAGRCGLTLHQGLWSIREILPEWLTGREDRGAMSMVEAICEPCRLDPILQFAFPFADETESVRKQRKI